MFTNLPVIYPIVSNTIEIIVYMSYCMWNITMKNKEKKYQYGYRQIDFSNNINLHCIYTNFCIELFVKKHTFEPIFALNYLFKNLKLALSWNMSFKTLVFTKGESKKFQNSIIFRKFFTFISQGDERVLSAIKLNGR